MMSSCYASPSKSVEEEKWKSRKVNLNLTNNLRYIRVAALYLKGNKMGNLLEKDGKSKAILDTLNDARIDKVNKKFQFTDEEMITLYTSFNVFDTEGLGYITTDNFFKKLLGESRTAFGDAALQLIEMKNPEVMTFGEYLDFIGMFCLFEEKDILSLAFKMFDPEKIGFIDKDELIFF